MKSYPQRFSTGVWTLWNTPKITRKIGNDLHGGCTLDAYNTHPDFKGFHKNEVLSNHSKKKNINKKMLLLLIVSLSAPIGANSAHSADYSIDHLKLYAHSRILNYVEFQCFNRIITKESRWDYRAKNGSHFGLGQMKSKHYRDLDPYRQIDASIAYIKHRYQTPCNAWLHHQSKNWF